MHSPFQQHHQTNWWKRNGLKAFHCLHSNQSVGINCFHSIFCSVVNSRWTWKQQHFLLTANLLNVSLQNCMTFDSYQELHLIKFQMRYTVYTQYSSMVSKWIKCIPLFLWYTILTSIDVHKCTYRVKHELTKNLIKLKQDNSLKDQSSQFAWKTFSRPTSKSILKIHSYMWRISESNNNHCNRRMNNLLIFSFIIYDVH